MEKGPFFDHTTPLRECSPLGHAPPVINFSSFSTFLPLWINDNKNFFWHYFFPCHWCLFDGLVFCHTDTSGTNYYTILKSDNQGHISFYTFFVHFISLVNSLQNGIGSFPIFSSFLCWSTNFILHTLVGWWLFTSFDWYCFLLQTLTCPCILQCFGKWT